MEKTYQSLRNTTCCDRFLQTNMWVTSVFSLSVFIIPIQFEFATRTEITGMDLQGAGSTGWISEFYVLVSQYGQYWQPLVGTDWLNKVSMLNYIMYIISQTLAHLLHIWLDNIDYPNNNVYKIYSIPQ